MGEYNLFEECPISWQAIKQRRLESSPSPKKRKTYLHFPERNRSYFPIQKTRSANDDEEPEIKWVIKKTIIYPKESVVKKDKELQEMIKKRRGKSKPNIYWGIIDMKQSYMP